MSKAAAIKQKGIQSYDPRAEKLAVTVADRKGNNTLAKELASVTKKQAQEIATYIIQKARKG